MVLQGSGYGVLETVMVSQMLYWYGVTQVTCMGVTE
jgi:hypothetical protein